jgi:hypothetical protein
MDRATVTIPPIASGTKEKRNPAQATLPSAGKHSMKGSICRHYGHNAAVRSAIHATDGTLLAESESSWAFAKLSLIASVAGVEEKILQQFLDNCHGSSPE